MGDTMEVAVEEVMVTEEAVAHRGPRSRLDSQTKRKRHRQRRKRKLGRPPYPALQDKKAATASVRAQDIRREMFTNGQPVAPYNTTQFLIEDHGDLQNIDAQLNKAPDAHRTRTRDSSFSIDSDDDFFYSSPEDEEEFLTMEFSLEYQDLHVERLNNLSKTDIIHDYLMLENKYEKSLAELRKMKTDSGRDTDASSRSDVDVGEQLRLAHLENRRLKLELEKVKRENTQLQTRMNRESSVDSESDSSSSTSSSVEDSSSEDPGPPPKVVAKDVSPTETAAVALESPTHAPNPADIDDVASPETAAVAPEAASPAPEQSATPANVPEV